MLETIENILPVILSFVAGGSLLQLFTIKQDKARKSIDNSSEIMKQYQDLIKELRDEKDIQSLKISELRTQIDTLLSDNDRLEKENALLKLQFSLMELLYTNASMLRCDNILCKLRIPPMDKEIFKLLKKLFPNRQDDNGEE